MKLFNPDMFTMITIYVLAAITGTCLAVICVMATNPIITMLSILAVVSIGVAFVILFIETS